MGKTKVKGIIVQIGGDTVGLDKALEGVNKKAGSTQSQLKEVERLLKLDPTNTTLLEQKQRLLAKSISETREKLDLLNQANENARGSVKHYEEWQKAYQPIQTEIDKTQKKLKELKNQQAEMKDCGEVDTDAYKALTQEVEETSKKLRDLKKQAKEVNDQFGNPIGQEAYDALQREIIETENKMKSLQQASSKNLDKLEDSLDDVKDKVKGVGDALDDAGDKASVFGDVLKAEVLVEGAKSLVDTLKDVSEETKEYRKIMGSLEVSSEAAGYSAEQTQEAYKRLYGVLADDQSAATTLANLQALGLSQEQLLSMIDNTIGGWAKYGDSIPIDGLAEAINETAKTGQVTGTLADILNWGTSEGETFGQKLKDLTQLQQAYDDAVSGNILVSDSRIAHLQQELGLYDAWDESVEKIEDSEERHKAKLEALLNAGKEWNQTVSDSSAAEDRFNLALQQCSTEAERADLIMQMLANQGLSDAAEKWRENNASMIESNEANANLQEQMAILGEKIEPLVTRFTELIANVLDWFNGLDSGTQNFILTIVAVVAALGPLSSAFGSVSLIVGKLSGGSLPGLGSALSSIGTKVLPALGNAFSSVFGFIAANPVVWVIAAIAALVAAIAIWGDEIQGVLQKTDDFMQGVFAKDWTETFGPVLGGSLNGFMEIFKGHWDAGMMTMNGVIDFIRGVFTLDWDRAWNGIKEIFLGIMGGVEASINGVIGLINNLIETINVLCGTEWKKLDKLTIISGYYDKVESGPSDTENPEPEGTTPDGTTPLTLTDVGAYANDLEATMLPGVMTQLDPDTQGAALTDYQTQKDSLNAMAQYYYNQSRTTGNINVNVYGTQGQDVQELAELVSQELQNMLDQEEEGLR